MKLLEHFKELTLHPKNAEELKGLILQLALRGRLTYDITKTNNKIIEDRIDGLYEIPRGWYWDEFNNLVDFQMGKTPPSKESQYWDGGIPWISIADMETYSTVVETKKTISDLALTNHFKGTLVKKGTLIMSFKLTIGKTSILGVDACHNEAIISIYPKEKILQEFLFLFLPIISNSGVQVSALMGNTLNKGKIQSLQVPVPPLEEQKTIVAIVNQLFAEVEQLEALTKERIQLKADFVTSALNQMTQAAEQDTASQWEFLQQHFGTFFTEKENIKKLREGILQLAVQGKLTRDWRAHQQAVGIPIEHASTLVEKIKAEKEQLIKEKKIKKEKPLPEISEEEIPYELPEGWVWCRFQEIFDIRDGTHDSPKDAFGSDTFPLITSKNFINGEIKFETARRISREDYSKVIKRSQVHKGDILFSMIGGNIGNQVEVGDFTEFAIKNVALFKHYRLGLPSEGFLKLFSQFIALSLQEAAAGGAQPFVSLKFFRNLIVGLPPTEEQKAIVEKVNSLMALCDKLEREIETHQTTQEEWMQSCLREVFEN